MLHLRQKSPPPPPAAAFLCVRDVVNRFPGRIFLGALHGSALMVRRRVRGDKDCVKVTFIVLAGVNVAFVVY